MRIAVEDLTGGYGSAMILDDVCFDVPEHAALAVVGRNGMGKTTLLKTILGYLRPQTGTVAIAGRTVTGWSTHRIARSGVAYAPQEQALFADLTVGENLAIGRGRHCPAGVRSAVLEAFPVLGSRSKQLAGTLSGGEQKMLALAKAMVATPDLLVLDEISDGMQPAVVTAVSQALRELREQRGCTILMVEQNLDLSLAVADQIAVLKIGRIVHREESTAAGVREDLVGWLAP
jgi:ABC-type branched-subunit amino acid transport system ATPase component